MPYAQHATVILEFKYKDGNVIVNLPHELEMVENAKSTYFLHTFSFGNSQMKAVKS